VEQYLLAFDTDLAPIVGQQVTLTAANAAAVGPRIAYSRPPARQARTITSIEKMIFS
jgi:hypothetical protein